MEGHKGSRARETNAGQFEGELQQEGAKRRKEVAYHLSCARQVASMKKETRRSCSARKRIESEYCRLKGSFTENSHGRVEITQGCVPVAEEQTEKTHGRVEITHGRVMVTVEQTEETHGPVEIPQGRGAGAGEQTERTHGRVEIPHGRVEIQIFR